MRKLGTLLFAAVLSVHSMATEAQTSGPVIEAVRERVEALSAAGRLSVEGTSLSAVRSLPMLYELHGFQPFWDSARLAKLLRASPVHLQTGKSFEEIAAERRAAAADSAATRG